MEKMQISLVSVREHDGKVVARARATAPDAGAQIWIKVEFQRSGQEPWQEARDRVLAVLDVA